MTRVLFFGGNGHTAARLDAVQTVLARPRPPFELRSVPYPGFEDRPRAPDFEAFLESVATATEALLAPAPALPRNGVARSASSDAPSQSPHALDQPVTPPGLPDDAAPSSPATWLYATGIGGLLVLCLRARGALRDVPALFQAPVLWGLERRWMPRLLRLGFAQVALRRAFASPAFQRRFARKHFRVAPSPETARAFFQGYASCAALPDFFAWLTPALLRSLEAAHAKDPALLGGVRFLWGANDTVVPPREIAWSEEALGVRLDVTEVPEWGHYPMIDDPEGWVREVSRVAGAASLR